MSHAKTELHSIQERYKSVVAPKLKEELGLTNVMEIPKLLKISINCGAGKAAQDKKVAQNVQTMLTAIAGQHAVITRARKSEAGFSIREGWPVGCRVTLRGRKMYEFLERLLVVALPRVRDFRGLNPRSFDGQGNYTFGIREHIVFPEIDFDKVDTMMGLDISLVTSTKDKASAFALLKALGLPFRANVQG